MTYLSTNGVILYSVQPIYQGIPNERCDEFPILENNTYLLSLFSIW